jgi:hypothetical protein
VADEDIENAIEESATSGIRRVTSDGTSTETHSIQDQIAADRYLKSQRAARRGIGLKRSKLIPGDSD